MWEWLTPVLVFAGVVVSGVVTYFIARRTTSGNISTSDAASLWAESNALRKEYRERAEQLEAQLQAVNDKLAKMTDELTKLRANSSVMIEKIEELKQIIAELRAENERLLALKKEQ